MYLTPPRPQTSSASSLASSIPQFSPNSPPNIPPNNLDYDDSDSIYTPPRSPENFDDFPENPDNFDDTSSPPPRTRTPLWGNISDNPVVTNQNPFIWFRPPPQPQRFSSIVNMNNLPHSYNSNSINSIKQQSFKHIPKDTTLYDPIMMENENLHEYLKTKDNLVFIFGNNYFPVNKNTIRMQIENPLNIVYECINPDVQFIIYLPDGSTKPNENINIKKKYLRLNSLGLPGDFIPLIRITKILLDKHQIYNIVVTDKTLKTVVSDNVLYHRGSYVGASHCQAGQGGRVYDLNKKIIRVYSKRNRKRVLSITKKKRGYFSKSKSSKIKMNHKKRSSSRSRSRESSQSFVTKKARK